MERTVLRILGKKGRTTIPWPIREELEWFPGDVLLFEPDPPDRVVITRMEVVEPEPEEFEVEYAHNSTALAGNSLTLEQTRAILDAVDPPQDSGQDVKDSSPSEEESSHQTM